MEYDLICLRFVVRCVMPYSISKICVEQRNEKILDRVLRDVDHFTRIRQRFQLLKVHKTFLGRDHKLAMMNNSFESHGQYGQTAKCLKAINVELAKLAESFVR